MIAGILVWSNLAKPTLKLPVSIARVSGTQVPQTQVAAISATVTSASNFSLPPTIFTVAPTVTPTPKPANLDEVVQTVVNKWDDSLGASAEYGLVVHNLDTGAKVSINSHKNFETASVYKMLLLAAVYYDISQNNLSLDTPITLVPDADDEEEDGYQLLAIGDSLPVRDLLDNMIMNSNNTASLMLLFQVKIARFQQIIANLGFKESDLSDSFNFQATPEDLDQFLDRLAHQKLLNPQADKAMLDLLLQQRIQDRIPALLPAGTKVANKPGNLGNVSNDTGIIFLPNGQRLAVTVMIHNFVDAEASYKFISQISLAAYNYYSSNP